MTAHFRSILLSTTLFFTFALFSFAIGQSPFLTQQFSTHPLQLDTLDELTFHSQQIPVRSGDTVLEFQGHFLCSESTPCERQWTFIWTGFDRSQVAGIVLSSVDLYLYDLNTYTTTRIFLQDPAQLDSYTATIDFPQTPNSLYSVYGYITYSTPITPAINQMLLQSEMSIKTIGYTRYRFILIPVIFQPFSNDYTPENVLPNTTSLDQLDETTSSQPKVQISSISISHRALPTQNTGVTFTPHYVYLSPTITFKSPFLNLSPAQRDTAFDPTTLPLFNTIYVELFGYSKWIEESRLTTGNSTTASPYQFTPYCYINDVPVQSVILLASQSQVLSLSISSYAYQSIFIPMIQNNQTHASIQCNGNFWMYYHPVNYLPEGCPEDTPVHFNQQRSPHSPQQSNSTTNVSNPLIPYESMAIYFMTIASTIDNGVTSAFEAGENRNVNTPDVPSTIPSSAAFESLSGATWLLIADRFQLSNTMYYCTEKRSLATPRLNLLSTQIVLHNQLDLPWEQTIQSYQKSWIKCTYSLDLTDNFTIQKFDPKNNDIIIDFQSSLRYVQSKSYINYNDPTVDNIDNDINTSAPLTEALLIISPSIEFRKQHQAKSILLTLPLQHTTHPSIINPATQQPYISSENQYTTTAPISLTDNFQQMFKNDALRNLTDYSYLNKQLYTLYYPITIKDMNSIASETIQCGIDISMNWNHHFNDGSDSYLKTLDSQYYNTYTPLIPQVIYPAVTTFSDDDLDDEIPLVKPTASKQIFEQIFPIAVFNQDTKNLIEWIDIHNTANQSFNVTLNLTLFDEPTSQQIEFFSLHTVDGIAFFNYTSPQDKDPVCTTNYPAWLVIPNISTSTQNTLRLQFLYKATSDAVPFTANKIDFFNIQCPTIFLQSSRMVQETIKNGTISVESIFSLTKYDIYNTILSHFQYRNETHYSIYQYNVRNPFESDISRALALLVIIILSVLGGLLVISVISGLICVKSSRSARPTGSSLNTQEATHIDPNSYGGYASTTTTDTHSDNYGR